MSDTWTAADMPDQTGRTAIVTGPTAGGLGFHTALELARRGARVVLAGRSEEKLTDAATAVRTEHPAAELLTARIDLASLASVRSAAGELADLGPIHLLVNNAGVMATPHRRTEDGLELQMATNHFGPFLLTGLLLPQLAASGGGRVVTVSSAMHRVAPGPPLDNPYAAPRLYNPWLVYGQSKLANLLFTHELDHRLRAAQLPVKALAAHPGLSGTHLLANGPRFGGVLQGAVRAMSQSAAAGAWPTLMAATEDLPGGTYCGPARWEVSGPAKVVGSTRMSRDERSQRRLWEISERVTGISYP